MKALRTLLRFLGAGIAVSSCGAKTSWTETELRIITDQDMVMKVYTATADELAAGASEASASLLEGRASVGNDDGGILRSKCSDFTAADLASPAYEKLCGMMVATVTSPEQDGVGIAGPQVGLNRRIVAVQRVDKEGEPFEVYPNIRIIATRGDKFEGGEGCLSVPGLRGTVMRWRDIDICWSTLSEGQLKDTVERVEGFAAVIFQHECDHLDGVLYTDKAETLALRQPIASE